MRLLLFVVSNTDRGRGAGGGGEEDEVISQLLRRFCNLPVHNGNVDEEEDGYSCGCCVVDTITDNVLSLMDDRPMH